MPIKIDYTKCCYRDGKCQKCSCKSGSSCDGCAEICPTQALVKGKKLLEFDKDKCIDCQACIPACKYGAISMEE